LIILKLVLSSGLCGKLFLIASRYKAMDDDLKILVLGDEESPEDLIEFELSKSNLRFITLRVTSREAFLQALQESSPSLIMITTGQTKIGGLTAFALAQECCPGTPCFLISPPGPQKRVAGGQENPVDGANLSIQDVPLEPSISSFFMATGMTSLVWDRPEVPFEVQDPLQPLWQVTGVIIAFLSPDGRILALNHGAERLTGWGRHEILGQDGVELFFPGTHRISVTAHLNRVLSGKSAEGIDLPLKLRQGLTLSYRWYCNLVSDRLGQPAGIMLVGQHLSEPNLLESLPRARLARACSSPAVRRSRGLITHRTGTC
jgi:PAS domain S-box-containing protein